MGKVRKIRGEGYQYLDIRLVRRFKLSLRFPHTIFYSHSHTYLFRLLKQAFADFLQLLEFWHEILCKILIFREFSSKRGYPICPRVSLSNAHLWLGVSKKTDKKLRSGVLLLPTCPSV